MATDNLPMDFGSDKPFYVYLYRDPRAGKRLCPIYVGKGTARHCRAEAHLRNKRHKNPGFAKVLALIQGAGLSPIIEVVQWFDEEDSAYKAETALIKKIGRVSTGDGPLLNVDAGGWGGRRRGASTIEKMRSAAKAAWEKPEFRRQATERALVMFGSVEARTESSRRSKQLWKDPQYANARSEDKVALWKTLKFREKMKVALAKRSANPEYRKRMSEGKRAACATPEFKKEMSA